MKIKIYETIKDMFKKYRNFSENDIDYENVKIILKNDSSSFLIDVRSPQEYKEGHLDKSINIPLYDIKEQIKNKVPAKETTLIIYCQSGNRSRKAVEILKKEGYDNLYNIVGGMDNL